MTRPTVPSEFTGRNLCVQRLVGLRLFELDDNGSLYSPVWTSFKWQPGANVARHVVQTNNGPAEIHPDEEVGRITCGCGFYAFTDRDPEDPSWISRAKSIWGVVEAGGLVTKGARGFRAQQARIVALVDPTYTRPPAKRRWPWQPQPPPPEPNPSQILRDEVTRLKARYAGVEWFDTIPQMLAAHPLGIR